MFALSSYLYAYAECIILSFQGDELEDAKETPEEIALNFTCAMFETPEAVLKGARHMVCADGVEDVLSRRLQLSFTVL